MNSSFGLETNSSYENEYFQFISMKGKLGTVLTAVSHHGLSALLLGEDREELERDLRREFPDEKPVSGGYGLEGIGSRIVSFTEDPRIGVSLPLDVRGTTFQKRVWEELRSIPPGEQRTYSEVAGRVGIPGDSFAIAQACLANRIAIAIPCHRVIADDGEIGVYRWGRERKRALLRAEANAQFGSNCPHHAFRD
jgi:AraC family transcriptional regulator of adaptative response/methylated-DNA-[protein]-cysteine methyltransferase